MCGVTSTCGPLTDTLVDPEEGSRSADVSLVIQLLMEVTKQGIVQRGTPDGLGCGPGG